MKNENLIRAIGTLDEDLIERSEKHSSDSANNKTNRYHFYRKPKWLAACIAALLVIGTIGVCAAVGVFDGFFKHFTGEVETYWDKISSTISSAANDDLEISIDGAVADKRQCLIVFSTIALSNAGKEIVNKNKGRISLEEMEVIATLKDGTNIKISGLTSTSYKGAHSSSNGETSCLLEIRPLDIEISSIKTLDLSYKGLSLELNVQNDMNMMEYKKLHSDDANALDVVEMSPIGFYFEVPVTNTDIRALRDQEASIEMNPISADGTLSEVGIRGTYIYDEARGVIRIYEYFVVNANKTLINTIEDLSKYSGIQINGINYYKTES